MSEVPMQVPDIPRAFPSSTRLVSLAEVGTIAPRCPFAQGYFTYKKTHPPVTLP